MYFKNLLRIQVIGSDWLAQAGDFAQWSGFFPSVRIVDLMSYSKHAQVQRETCGSRQTFPCWRKNHPLWAKHKASRDTRAPLPPVLIFVCSNWDFARVHGNPSLRRFAAAGWICQWHPRAVSKRSFSPASRRKPTIMQLGEIYGWNRWKKTWGEPKTEPQNRNDGSHGTDIRWSWCELEYLVARGVIETRPGYVNSLLLKIAIEIVDLPIKNGDFPQLC